MRLTPQQILEHLGFVVPTDGVEVSADDSLYHVTALQLLGKTLSATRIPDQALHERHARMTAASGMHHATSNDAESAEKSRTTLRAAVQAIYGLAV